MFVFMGLPTGLAAAVGLTQSSAMAEILPWWGIRIWAVALAVGCVAWLVGLTSVHEDSGSLVLTRLPAMILGLHLVSITCLTYAVAVFLFAGWLGLLTATLYLVIAGGTWLRRVDLITRQQGDRP